MGQRPDSLYREIMAKEAYIEIAFVPTSSPLTFTSIKENNVSRIGELSNFRGLEGFKGLYLNGGKIKDGKVSGTLLNGEFRLFPDAGYPGYNGAVLSSETDTGNGYQFLEEEKITFSSQGELRNITIRFDNVAGEYCTEYRLASDSPLTVRRNSSYLIIIPIPEGQTSETIYFLKWSKPNSVNKITLLVVGYVGTYEARHLRNLDIELSDSSSPYELRYGLVSQTGNLEIFNLAQEFTTLNNIGVLTDSLEVNIFAKKVGEPTEQFEQIASMQSLNWVVDENKPTIKLELKDRLLQLKERQLQGFPLAQRTGLQAFEMIFSNLGWVEGVDYVYTAIDGWYNAENPTQDTTTKQVLRTYIFPNHFGVFNNAWSNLDSLLVATHCVMYTNKNGMACIKRRR